VFLSTVIIVNIGNIFDNYTNNNDSKAVFYAIFALSYENMNRFLLIAVFFAILITTEVAITAMAAQVFDICVADKAADGETEKDSKEKSEKDSKVEILLGSVSENQDLLLKSLFLSKKSIFSKPYLDEATPPPKV